jgi:RNA polymerase sigma factor (sigma-70 family)
LNSLDDLQGMIDRLAISPSDEVAWRSLYTSIWPFVTAVLHRKLGPSSRGIIEDAAQETFIRLLQAKPFDRIKGPDSLRGYLWRIADNVARDFLRKSRDQKRTLDDLAKAVERSSAGRMENGEADMSIGAMVECIEDCLGPDEKTLLQLLLQDIVYARLPSGWE